MQLQRLTGRHRIWASLSILLAACVIGFTACAPDPDPDPPDNLPGPGGYELQDDVVSLGDQVLLMGQDGVLALDDAPEGLSVGSILHSTGGAGLLRRVTNVSESDGQAVVRTEQADLTDLLRSANLSYSGKAQEWTIIPAPGVTVVNGEPEGEGAASARAMRVELFHVELELDVPIVGDDIVLSGNLTFAVPIEADLRIGWFTGIEEFYVTIGFEASADLDLRIASNVEIADLVFEVKLADVYGSPILLPPPPALPVLTFVPKGELLMRATASVAVEAGVDITLDVVDLRIAAGPQYRKDEGWSLRMEPDSLEDLMTAWEVNVAAYGEVNAVLEVTPLVPRLELLWMGIGGPYLELACGVYSTAALGLEADTALGYSRIYGEWDVGFLARLQAGMTVDLLPGVPDWPGLELTARLSLPTYPREFELPLDGGLPVIVEGRL